MDGCEERRERYLAPASKNDNLQVVHVLQLQEMVAMMEPASSLRWYVGFIAMALAALIIVLYQVREKLNSRGPKKDKDTTTKNVLKKETEEAKSKSSSNNNSGWKCACEGGGIFLPQSLAGPVAMMRMGAGGCYHKQM